MILLKTRPGPTKTRSEQWGIGFKKKIHQAYYCMILYMLYVYFLILRLQKNQAIFISKN